MAWRQGCAGLDLTGQSGYSGGMKTKPCPDCTKFTPTTERPWFRESCPTCLGSGRIPAWISMRDAAAMLGRSDSSIQRYVQALLIDCQWIHGRMLVSRLDVDAIAKGKRELPRRGRPKKNLVKSG